MGTLGKRVQPELVAPLTRFQTPRRRTRVFARARVAAVYHTWSAFRGVVGGRWWSGRHAVWLKGLGDGKGCAAVLLVGGICGM